MNTGQRTIVAAIAVVAVGAGWAIGRPTPAASQDGVEVFFSPKGGCTEVIIDMIEGARNHPSSGVQLHLSSHRQGNLERPQVRCRGDRRSRLQPAHSPVQLGHVLPQSGCAGLHRQ